ncbi:helix-turn-helix domain-containing protein [Streptosporangium sp. NPDC051023]|uniref:helix-turn-helix domain-containing protein n=1 Tax=Streptosporangium sp. NPDC051023 TaxID=3155410 RepID=UPI00344C211D
MLHVLGIPEMAGDIYRRLVVMTSGTPEELAEHLDAPPETVGAALCDLERRGLVTRTATKPPRFVAAPPDTVVEGLLLRRQTELNAARAELDDLVRAYRGNRHAQTTDELIEIVTGQEALLGRVRQLQHGARTEFCGFVKPPYVVQSLEESENLTNPEVTYRVLYDVSVMEHPELLHRIRNTNTPREELRVHPELPMKLMIADRRTALLPLARVGPASVPSAVIVHSSGLLDALLALFEHYWAASTPLPVDESAFGAGSPLDGNLPILTLLVAGATDRIIARQLGVSVRTVQRRVSDMMAAAGAQNRIQLGWYAAKNAWLDGPWQVSGPASDLRHGAEATGA